MWSIFGLGPISYKPEVSYVYLMIHVLVCGTEERAVLLIWLKLDSCFEFKVLKWQRIMTPLQGMDITVQELCPLMLPHAH